MNRYYILFLINKKYPILDKIFYFLDIIMSILDDTSIFAAVIQQGGFSHAAKFLGLSNGLVSRRINQLEKELGVTLIKRTTRQLHLTPEGKLLWEHAQRIQQELDSALSLIQAHAEKPKGRIRVSSTIFFGRHYLMPIIVKFMNNFPDIKVDLILTNEMLDPVKEHLDLVVRSTGYFQRPMKDSSMKMKQLLTQKIRLYASPEYLIQHGEPKTVEELASHHFVGYVDGTRLPDQETWSYVDEKGNEGKVTVQPRFTSNNIESGVAATVAGLGIGKYAVLGIKEAQDKQQLKAILQHYDWGKMDVFALFAQESLPKRTRMLLDYIAAHTGKMWERVID